MKQLTVRFILMALAIMLVGSCKKKEEQQFIITKKPEAAQPRQTERIGDYEQTLPFEWKGAEYLFYVNRHADESLPLADDGLGNKFFDNKIEVKIQHGDGSTIFSKTFTKADFLPYLDERSKRDDALLGVVFEKTEGETVYLAASVGSPDLLGSDEYTPFVVKVDGNGKISIAKDTQLDITGQDSDTSADNYDDEGV